MELSYIFRGGKFCDFPDLYKPVDKYAYSRAALLTGYTTICMYEKKIIKNEKAKLIVNVLLPSPPMISFYYGKEKYYEIKNASKSLEEESKVLCSNITVCDSLSNTILFLSNTREYIIKTLFQKKEYNNNCIPPKEVIKEIAALYLNWDKWTDDDKLDISLSKDIPRFKRNIDPSELISLVAQDKLLTGMMAFVFGHEYSHFLIDNSMVESKDIIKSAKNLLDYFIKNNVNEKNATISYCIKQLCENQMLYSSWLKELSADILSLNLLITTFPHEKVYVAQIIAFYCSIEFILEIYSFKNYSELYMDHPISNIRFLLLTIGFSKTIGWDNSDNIYYYNLYDKIQKEIGKELVKKYKMESEQ